MTTNTSTKQALDYYARIGAALFPIPAGSKDPTGIVGSFAHDYSKDPAQWERWRTSHPNCNFGMVAGPSNLIVVDIDTKQDRDAAWAAWCDLCHSWQIEPLQPTVQSARGGWHVLLQVPEGIDATKLRQPDAVKGKINVRAGNGYVVAAGSYYDGTAKDETSGHYILISTEPPHPAPQALIEHCTRRTAPPGQSPPQGTQDAGDIAAMVTWLNERDQFSTYEDWVSLGMALRIALGDAGYDIWMLATWPDAMANAPDKWQSFATDPTADSVTLASWIKKARDQGWRGTIRKSTEALFGQVAAIAQAAGASLSDQALPMLAGQEELARVSAPILADFLANTTDAPTRPLSNDYPQLPDVINTPTIHAPLSQAIARIIALSETPKGWKAQRVVDPLAVLSLVHPDTFEAVCRRLRTAGCKVPSIKPTASRISDQVERAFVQQDDWIRDARTGEPQNDNSDNIAVLLAVLGCEVRWNAWLERAEIKGYEWTRQWTYVDDTVIAKLRTRANRTGTRFRPSKEFFWEGMLALAHAAAVDPALEMLATLEADWDRQPRLSTWLAHACHTPCDPYHQAVGRNIIGGMVRRMREPGVKHDEVAIFYGPQGTGKSTMARILAIDPTYFSDEIMFGDASKELVLSLAGKSVVEVSEMGTKFTTNANHIKAMLSRQIDRGRTAYARSVTERPRRNLFIGTTNDPEPLSDPTGNRRFLPVHVAGEIDLGWLQTNVRQLVGEAAALHSAGTSFALPREVWSDAAARQEAARSETDVEVKLADWFGETPHTATAFITASDLVDAANLAGWRGAAGSRSAYMKRLGFRPDKTHLNGKRTRIWYRGPTAAIDKDAVRYMIGRTADGMVRVEIRRGGVG